MIEKSLQDRLGRLCLLLMVALVTVAAVSPAAAKDMPDSSAPALEKAAGALAGGRLDVAAEGFEAIARDPSAPAFVRGLAMLGRAEAALARHDTNGALSLWQRLAADVTLPPSHRDSARRRIAETKRIERGLPARDPVAYRVGLPMLPEPAAVFHVACDGSDAGDGSEARPFRTLARARDAVRQLKKSNNGVLPGGGVRILVGGGEYAVKDTWKLDAEDSGTAEAPIVYQAKRGPAPVLGGGVRVTGWKLISDVEIKKKLDPAIRDRVLQADLNALGVTDWGDATALRGRPELFVNGEPQTLARWPDEGFVKTGDILGEKRFKVWNRIEGCRDGKFRYLGERPSRWLDEPDVRLYGYWFWDWYEEYQTVAAIDPDTHSFTLSPPYSNYGYRKDQRYRAVNVFRELDSPGEWYLDRRTGTLYWLPPEGVDWRKAETVLSVFDEPFVVFNDVEHVVLLGLAFEEGRGDGIHIQGGCDCLVAGCMLRRFGGDAIVVRGGQRHGIFGCTMHTLGCGGTRVAGGDRQSLTPGHQFVENCTVSNISRLKRTYTPAVHLDGCCNRIAHNLFERIPSSAMRIEGNEHVIELNAIRNVVQESDDQGGLDMWGNPLYRGVVIRWNRWSDIVGGTHCGAAGIRLDDMISGVAVYGNVFERCGAELFGGVQIHGGKENLVDNNLFVDCYAGISFSRWGGKRWLESIQRFLEQAGQPPYSSRYPALAQLKEDADVNFVSRNIFAGCNSIFLRDGGVEKTALNAVIDGSFDMQAVSKGKPTRDGPQLGQILFEPIPLEEIGPYEHPWRAPNGD